VSIYCSFSQDISQGKNWGKTGERVKHGAGSRKSLPEGGGGFWEDPLNFLPLSVGEGELRRGREILPV